MTLVCFIFEKLNFKTEEIAGSKVNLYRYGLETEHSTEAFNRTIEMLISKISKDLCTVKPAQHKMIAPYKRFEVRRVSRPCLD